MAEQTERSRQSQSSPEARGASADRRGENASLDKHKQAEKASGDPFDTPSAEGKRPSAESGKRSDGKRELDTPNAEALSARNAKTDKDRR